MISTTRPQKSGMLGEEELERRFSHHEPSEEKALLHTGIRIKVMYLARKIDECVPDGREKSLAMTKLEEVMFWANAAIARSE